MNAIQSNYHLVMSRLNETAEQQLCLFEDHYCRVARIQAGNLALGNHNIHMPVNDLYQAEIVIISSDTEYSTHLHSLAQQAGFGNITIVENNAGASSHLQHAITHLPLADIILLHSAANDTACWTLHHTLQHPSIKTNPFIIISTSEEQDRVRAAGQQAGAADVLFYPITPLDLSTSISAVLGLKARHHRAAMREHELLDEIATHKATQARLQYLIAHDALTGLYNRRRLDQFLELAVIDANYNQRQSALFYLDLDQFKIINDSEGHSVGDELLVNVSLYLKGTIATICLDQPLCVKTLIPDTISGCFLTRHPVQTDSQSLLARISADDFALLIEDISDEHALFIGEALRQAMEGFSFMSRGQTYHITASIGIAMISPGKQATASMILAQADQACYAAKNKGRNKVQIFSPADKTVHNLQNDLRWAPIIQDALANNRFRLVFQPVLNISTNQITHYEALIRLLGSDNQLVAPGNFIPVAERMGLIQEIDFWVINSAIDWLHELPACYSYLSVNVNLSAHVLQDPSLVALVKDKLRVSGVEARRITFEITETAAIANFTQAHNLVEELRALGCRFALDDFGAGFNSYTYLKHIPVDYLKIDGAFITHLVNDRVDQVLVKSMIEIARTLGKKTIAEFVENAETLRLLKEYGVDYAQGYYLGEPQLISTVKGSDNLIMG